MHIFATLKNSLWNPFNFNVQKMKRKSSKSVRIQTPLIYKETPRSISDVGQMIWRNIIVIIWSFYLGIPLINFRKSPFTFSSSKQLDRYWIHGLWLEMKSFSSTLDSKCQQFKMAWFWSLNVLYCWVVQIEIQKNIKYLLPWEICAISIWFFFRYRGL